MILSQASNIFWPNDLSMNRARATLNSMVRGILVVQVLQEGVVIFNREAATL